MNQAEFAKLVEDMNSGGATVSLEQWAVMEKLNRNVFWMVDCGHHQNLLDKALERIEELEEVLLDGRS